MMMRKMRRKKNMKINVLGTEYTINEATEKTQNLPAKTDIVIAVQKHV